MQKAANLSFSFPSVLEQIFQRFSTTTDLDPEKLFLDLSQLLGKRLLRAALHLLEHQTITIYTKTPKTIEVVEITEIGRSFQLQVLGSQDPKTAPYTCKHALAVRLAFILQHKCLHIEEVQTHRLDLLLSYFLPENI